MMNSQKGCLEKVREARHERVAQTSKVCTITHFFGEDVGRINFARDMFDGERLIVDPFSHRIFTKLNVAGGLRCHIMRPFDASFIIVV